MMNRRLLVIVLVCLLIPCAAAWGAPHSYFVSLGGNVGISAEAIWYSPERLASADAAISAIRNLEGSFSIFEGYPTREMEVTRERLRVRGVYEGSTVQEQWVSTGGLTGYFHKTVIPDRDEKTVVVPFAQVNYIGLWYWQESKVDNKWGVQILTRSGTQQVIFLALTQDGARSLANAIATLAAAHGNTQPLLIGVYLIANPEYEAKLRKQLKVPHAKGAMVSFAYPDSPAAAAGIQKDDIILAVNGLEVADGISLPKMIANLPLVAEAATYSLTVTLWRGGQTLTKQVQVPNPN
jgi:hypothetical protein